MPNDPYYRTLGWLSLKSAVRRRSGGICEVQGCNHPAVVCDHIVSRGNGGRDSMDNLRMLCRTHDNQVKERSDGTRRGNGKFRVIGCDVNGWPLA